MGILLFQINSIKRRIKRQDVINFTNAIICPFIKRFTTW